MTRNYNKENKERLKGRFEELKKELSEVSSSSTIQKYQILSEAFKIGKVLHGRDYSLARLSYDMEVPYTTAKRVMSLSKATKEQWAMIKSKRIGAHKVAQILMSVDNDLAPDVMKLAIDKGWSTSMIKKYRHGNIRDIKLKASVEKGFADKWGAMNAVKTTTERLNQLLDLDVSSFPYDKREKLRFMLVDTRNKINSFLGRLK